ncbi:MAG: FAD-dependent oxidoreductase [Acidimicrobiia bacterium]|nr:FAD-dependent oxidoreductase [Acidimicrobiia bacterium]
MAEVIVVGGGIAGLCAGALLARDGHHVVLLERDGTAPPASPEDLWSAWERRGVGQFRMLHFFLARFREHAEAELPEVVTAMEEAGALRSNPLDGMPEAMSGGSRPGDERFTVLTGRRPVVEAAICRAVADQPGLELRRATAVRGLLGGEPVRPGVPHVKGVVTEDGTELHADLVVDASGRRSPLPGWLAAIGARPPEEEREDSGFLYYGRHFRSSDGSVPPAFGPLLQPYGSVSVLTLPADNGTWGVGVITSGSDAALRRLRLPEVWERVVKSYPLVAHWLDGEPISGVDVMANIEDRHRRYWCDGAPCATGVLAVGDSWACTNPSLGRGASIGLQHVLCLRDLLREVPAADASDLLTRWDEVTSAVVEPLYRDTLAFDRHRLAEIRAELEGVPYETEDPGWLLGQALRHGAAKDPDLLRGFLSVSLLLERGGDVLSRPGVAERAIALGQPEPAPGPDREQLLTLVGG